MLSNIWQTVCLFVTAYLCVGSGFKLPSTRLVQQYINKPRGAFLHATSNTGPPEISLDNLNIVNVELNDELKASFMSYAMSTILSRALPDARDGLKPVHRRVLYAMQQLNLTPDSSYRKCARIVGEVLGKYHPHGDTAVYDAMVRMAQDFVMLHPLVSGHGNFGSVDNDPPAAMRYTESKLSSLAFESLLADIKENTVDFVDNFDGNEQEPLVLPARLPMLLVNGASGIAVGMATNIPPHNLGELCDAVVALIDDPQLSVEALFKMVPGPDFPTGGFIIGTEGPRALQFTGHGSIVMRAKTHIETVSTGKGNTRSRNAIIVTELPYMTNKAALLVKIADLVNDKKLEGIADLRDESDREGMRVVIELKREAVPALVQNNLFKKTGLQSSFSGNMLALVEDGTQPRRVGLRDALQVFIKFRFETIRRRTAHQLEKASSRNHVVQGMLRALERIDDIIALLKQSKDTAAARKLLMSKEYKFSNEQAEAILSLTLRRLTAMEEAKLKDEEADLGRQIQRLNTLMSVDAEVHKVMRAETLALKKKHAVPRRSVILNEDAEISVEDLIANEKSVIMITKSGYIKRVPILEFEAQSRGGTGKAGARLSNSDDSVANFFACNDHDAVLFVTNRGIAYSVKAHQIPLGTRTARGVPLPQVLPIGLKEQVTSVFPVDSFEKEGESLVLLTELGYVKKTPLRAFQSITARGLTIISLGYGDSLKWTRRCFPHDQVLIGTKDGYATRFSAEDISSTGRTSRGVRALKLRPGDTMVDMDILSASSAEDEFVLAVTERGYGKRISISEFRTARRGCKGVIAIKFKKKIGGSAKSADNTNEKKDGDDSEQQKGVDSLSCIRICSPGDDVVLSTSRGTVIRQKVDDISVQSRSATGVLIQRMKQDDFITMVDVLAPSTEDMHEALPNVATK